MKKQILSVALFTTIFLVSCGGSSTSTSSTPTTSTETPAAEAPKPVAIETADWVATDLNPIASLIPVTINLPKDAKKEKNGNGGADIRLNEAYLLTVSAPAVSSAKEALEDVKTLSVKHSSYK